MHTVLSTVINSIHNLYSVILEEAIAAACIKNTFHKIPFTVKNKENSTDSRGIITGYNFSRITHQFP